MPTLATVRNSRCSIVSHRSDHGSICSKRERRTGRLEPDPAQSTLVPEVVDLAKDPLPNHKLVSPHLSEGSLARSTPARSTTTSVARNLPRNKPRSTRNDPGLRHVIDCPISQSAEAIQNGTNMWAHTHLRGMDSAKIAQNQLACKDATSLKSISYENAFSLRDRTLDRSPAIRVCSNLHTAGRLDTQSASILRGDGFPRPKLRTAFFTCKRSCFSCFGGIRRRHLPIGMRFALVRCVGPNSSTKKRWPVGSSTSEFSGRLPCP